MKRISAIILLLLSISIAYGQNKFFTKNGKVYFDATTKSSPEKIEATNEKATSILDVSTGVIEFAVLMKAFTFQKALMQEHFNENYIESDKYPKAVFKGNITNISSVDLKKDGIYPVKVKGMMTLHGETKEISADGNITIKNGQVVSGTSTFKIQFADFKIEIPSLVNDKVAKEANIKVDLIYELYKT